jgi:hypothetical protein
MASGVEMLGQMSETEALAGPVSGGNMVVKPNEVPVGGAAMLAKALRGQANKGIGGIYELPSQKAPTPEFMQMAKAGLRKGDMLRGMGPRKGLTAYDMANMAGAVEQAGIINFLGEQPEVTAPIRAKSHADAPPTQLAYITDAEKQMLLDANIHGSLEGNKPNPGPAGIQSLDDFYNIPGGGVGGGSTDRGESYASASDYGVGSNQAVGGGQGGTGGQVFQQQDDGGYKKVDKATQQAAEKTAQQTTAAAQQAGETAFETFKKERDEREKKLKAENDKLKLQNSEERLAVLNAKKNLSDSEKKEKSSLTNLIDKIKTEGAKLIDSGLNLFGDSEQDKKDKARIEELLKLAEGDKYNLSGSQRRELEKLQLNTSMAPAVVKALGNFAAGIAGPEEDQFADDNYLNILESEILPKYGGTREEQIAAFAKEYDDRIPGQNIGPDGQDFGTYDPAKSLKMLLDNKGDIKPGSDLQKRLKPVDYYKDNQPQTSGGLTDMAQNLTMADIKNSGLPKAQQRRLSARLMEAREAASKDRGGNQFNRPSVMQDTIAEEVVETPDGVIDEEAQTMKFTSPRTGGKEVNVPLQRRFKTDPTKDVAQFTTAPRTESDILKYMTEGTTGEGIDLEPFSEYQRRRRKAMGLEPLGLYG